MRAYSDGWEAENSLARFLWRNCHARPHSSLGGRIPHEVYAETKPCSFRPGLTMSLNLHADNGNAIRAATLESWLEGLGVVIPIVQAEDEQRQPLF